MISCPTRFFDDKGRAGPLDPLPASARLQVSQRLRQVDLRVSHTRPHRNGILALHVDQEGGEKEAYKIDGIMGAS